MKCRCTLWMVHVWFSLLILVLSSGVLNAESLSLQILHKFYSPEPLTPSSGVVRTADGSLYGTAPQGGANGAGGIYRIAPNGQMQVLAVFGGSPGYPGNYPQAGLVAGPDGNLYGTLAVSGPYGAWASAFRISPSGVYTNFFQFYGTNGYSPYDAMILGNDGNLYGTTRYGGPGYGVLYKLTLAGQQTVLQSFTGANGLFPDGRMVQASDGYIYGATSFGGAFDLGTIFRVSPVGDFQTMYSFDRTNGARPTGGLMQASDGNLYGMTEGESGDGGHGIIFKFKTNGQVITVAKFEGATNGRYPSGYLVQRKDGKLYGVTQMGGEYDGGTLFSVSTNGGELSILVSFSDSTGRWPTDVTLGSDGNLYGTTSVQGGSFVNGTVFRAVPTPEIALTLSNGMANLRWNAFTGGVYQVQERSGLNPTNWAPLGSAIVSTGEVASAKAATSGLASKFYRVVLYPPW